VNNIKIYTTDWCPACVVAKKVLDEKGYSYTEINIEQEGITRKQLKEITGRWEVPAIIIDGVNIGGLDNLIKRI
jgi:glutaredoxin 3|tara:strand:+ start:1443 stop:1664 length:222 start_codon:yes stop_codon:yes gene_type:complete